MTRGRQGDSAGPVQRPLGSGDVNTEGLRLQDEAGKILQGSQTSQAHTGHIKDFDYYPKTDGKLSMILKRKLFLLSFLSQIILCGDWPGGGKTGSRDEGEHHRSPSEEQGFFAQGGGGGGGQCLQ